MCSRSWTDSPGSSGSVPRAARRSAGSPPTRRGPRGRRAALVGGVAGDDAVQLREERRLFYGAMTRAREELVLSPAVDYGGGGIRRPSPFVVGALALPPASVDPSIRAAS